MKTIFINGATSKEERKKLRNEALIHLKNRQSDFEGFIEYGTDIDDGEQSEAKDKFFEETGSFYDYGLAVDYVAPQTFERQREGYFRYQLSYGGPSEEIRFYFSPGAQVPYRIEFVYLNWGTGVSFRVTEEDWAMWLWEHFNDSGTVQSELNKSLED
jgi:hypothetical protein